MDSLERIQFAMLCVCKQHILYDCTSVLLTTCVLTNISKQYDFFFNFYAQYIFFNLKMFLF